MWLEVHRRYRLLVYDPQQTVIPCRVDVMSHNDEVPPAKQQHIVGRFLADELRLDWIDDYGEIPSIAADADSAALDAAWSSVVDERGELRQGDELGDFIDSVVYCYRFELHPDFATWKLAAIDGFCRSFGTNALILMQRQMCEAHEFEHLNFTPLPPAKLAHLKVGKTPADRSTEFVARSNNFKMKYKVADYPEDCPSSKDEHEAWLEAKGNWSPSGGIE